MYFNLLSCSTLAVTFIAVSIVIMFDRIRYQRKYNSMRNHYISLLTALASAIDARDPNALGHTERVKELSKKVASELNKHGHNIDLDALELAALLHDVGKIGIPESILRKPGPPTKKEWKEIKKHPAIGANILAPLEELNDVKEAIQHHQEHYDGLGYPNGLKAEKIPLMSRIIMVVDAYDAITSDRVYRAKRVKEEAIEEILQNMGTQFDPEVVKAFVAVIKDSNPG